MPADVFSADASDSFAGIQAAEVHHWPIVRAYAERLGLRALINRLVPTERAFEPGLMVLAMIVDTLCGRSPLYHLASFFEDQDTEVLLGETVESLRMTDYKLYYWPLPFRGQFVRSVLAHVHATWDEADVTAISSLRHAAPSGQLVPHMEPPVLTDYASDCSLTQTAAILGYLGRKHGLIPEDPVRAALTTKIIADANDVLYEMTLHNGAQMWTKEAWKSYRPGLSRWMEIFEETGRRHGLMVDEGNLLGTETLGIADLTAHILWGTMTAKFPILRSMLDTTAPAIAGLSDRIASLPEQDELRRRSDAEYGDEWCSGEIEASLRAVL